ncbi:MAG: thioesterase family protein [Thermoleophilum sp.]|nr:thioesterase family protein [Thermoleophilum sp.]
MPGTAVFEHRGDGVYVASEYARGPWDPRAQHGGAPAALIVRVLEQLDPDPDLQLARVTYELVRPVPLGELHLETSVLRRGRRVHLLEATLADAAGKPLVLARALRVARAEVTRLPVEDRPPPPPDAGELADDQAARATIPGVVRPMFGGDALEIRFVRGSFAEPGPATAWFRLRVPLVAGEAPSPLVRLAAAADFPNGIGASVPWSQFTFLNPDLTLTIEREPEGEWVCLDAAMRVHAGGVGVAEATLYDRTGRVGRAVQSVLVQRR